MNDSEKGPAGDPGGGAIPRPPRISVVGAGTASDSELEMARMIGRRLGEAGAVVVTGGLGGVMEAASRGCIEAGGLTVGILPGGNPDRANRWVSVPLATGLGQARNVLVARSGDAVLAVGGSWGTLSEIALARKVGIPVGLVGTPPTPELGLPYFDDPDAAVAWALERAR